MTISQEHHVPAEAPPSDEEREAMIGLLAASIHDLAGLAWKRYEAHGRGLVVIPVDELAEAVGQSEALIPTVFELPYQTEASLRQRGLSGPALDQVMFFLDSYDPRREVVFLVLRYEKHSYFVIQTEPTPQQAGEFVGRFN